MNNEKNDASWEVEDGKIKSKTSWKTLKQIQFALFIQATIAVAFVAISVWAFSQHIFFGILSLVIAIFAGLAAYGSYDAMNILRAKDPKAVKTKTDEKPKSSFIPKLKKPTMPKAKENAKKEKVEEEETLSVIDSFKITVGKTTVQKRQETIADLAMGAMLFLDENYVVSTKSGLDVGELTKTQIEKIKNVKIENLQCKVLEVSTTKAGKKSLKVELEILG